MTATTTAKKPHRWLWRSLIILVVVLIVARGGVQHLRVVGPAGRAVGLLRPTRASCRPARRARSSAARTSTTSPPARWPSGCCTRPPIRAATPIAVSGVVVTPTGDPPAGRLADHRLGPRHDGCRPPLRAVDRLPRRRAGAGARGAATSSPPARPSCSPTTPASARPVPHPYLVGESEGRAVLDSIRAARALLGDAVSNTAAIYGHSQGGHAAVWADLLAPTYAPDLNVAGVAAMAPPTDLGALLDRRRQGGRRHRADRPGHLVVGPVLPRHRRWTTVVEPVARPVVRDLGTKCIAHDRPGPHRPPRRRRARGHVPLAGPDDGAGLVDRACRRTRPATSRRRSRCSSPRA